MGSQSYCRNSRCCMGTVPFHYYHYGNRVIVYTDHSAVRAVLETASPIGRHACWWTRVFSREIKQVTILHCSGRENVILMHDYH